MNIFGEKETRGRPSKRGKGRPVKDGMSRKNLIVKCRINEDLYNKLYYLRGVTGKSDSEILREGIEEMFDKQMNRL